MGWESRKGSFPAADNRHEHPLCSRSLDISALLTAAQADLDFTADPLRMLFVGGAGDLVLKFIDDTSAVTWTCPAGTTIHGLIGTIVYSGTTATLIVGAR